MCSHSGSLGRRHLVRVSRRGNQPGALVGWALQEMTSAKHSLDKILVTECSDLVSAASAGSTLVSRVR